MREVVVSKRIVICADGTWNRPERNIKEDFPTNVLKLSRAIRPISKGISQQVFYDWGLGSYYDPAIGGATGTGINKNIKDSFRYIVQNYHPGDEIFLFGFSRGAYTVRSLCGMINNCGILKRADANLIEKAFNLYKKSGAVNAPNGINSENFRKLHSHGNPKSPKSRTVKFVGVWDTIGALGIPFSFLGFLNKEHEFYDRHIGDNVQIARHAMAIDELRSDFEPTIWEPKSGLDLKQVWFAGVHSDIGGSYKPDKDGSSLADISLKWMLREAGNANLGVESHLTDRLRANSLATQHNSRRHIFR